MNTKKNTENKPSNVEIVRKLRDLAWQDSAHSDNIYDDAADAIEKLEKTIAEMRVDVDVRAVIGIVEGRPVHKGDKLYVDIRDTCATEWGSPGTAVRGANEGQGPMIIFESGDYRMVSSLVWEPREGARNE